ncbi:hypothetical protein [Rhodoferax koreensis]|nr:hypothetical protein [Rhodoferax koreense]
MTTAIQRGASSGLGRRLLADAYRFQSIGAVTAVTQERPAASA